MLALARSPDPIGSPRTASAPPIGLYCAEPVGALRHDAPYDGEAPRITAPRWIPISIWTVRG